jgi:hypothetical protein
MIIYEEIFISFISFSYCQTSLICSTSYQEHFHSNSLYGLRKKIGWGSLIGLGGLLLTIFHLFATQF